MSFVVLGRNQMPIIMFESDIASNFLRLGIRSLKLGGSLAGGGDTTASDEAALGDLGVPGDCNTPNFLQSALTCFTCLVVSFFFYFDFVNAIVIRLILLVEDIM